jgi:hypothetical protein
VPVLRNIGIWLTQDQQALDEATSEEAARAKRRQPSAKRKPSRDITEEHGEMSRCKHRNPVVLAARSGCNRDQLRENHEGGHGANPNQYVAVNVTGRAAILEAD